MIVRNKQQIAAMKRAASGPFLIIRIPIHFGSSSHELAEVYEWQRKALVIPGSRCGALVADWGQFMRYARRHGLM